MRSLLRLTIFATIVSSVAGCASMRPVVLHPITNQDIFYVPTGTVCGKVIAAKDGYFLSDTYLKEVLNAQVEK